LVLLFAQAAWAAPTRVAIAPVRESPDAAPIERALADAIRDTHELTLVSGVPKRAGTVEPAQRARELAAALSAQRVLFVEAARLGDGRVLYLQGLDASGRTIGSTTVPLQKESGEVVPADRPALRAAVVRALAPERFVGRLQLKVDVPNAEVQLDGSRAKELSAQGEATLAVPVGTHALRVTHPAYHDFLRFVDIEFDKTLPLEVALSAYPLAEGEMTERMRRAQRRTKVPWWRSWWALSIAGAVITGVTAGAVWATRPGVTSDHASTYVPPQTP
jgi:hypothetical protein